MIFFQLCNRGLFQGSFFLHEGIKVWHKAQLWWNLISISCRTLHLSIIFMKNHEWVFRALFRIPNRCNFHLKWKRTQPQTSLLFDIFIFQFHAQLRFHLNFNHVPLPLKFLMSFFFWKHFHSLTEKLKTWSLVFSLRETCFKFLWKCLLWMKIINYKLKFPPTFNLKVLKWKKLLMSCSKFGSTVYVIFYIPLEKPSFPVVVVLILNRHS